MTISSYPLDLVVMESPKDPLSQSGTIKHVKRTKIYSNLNTSDDGGTGGEDRLETSNGEYVPSPVLPVPKFSNNNKEGEGEGNENRSGLSTSSGSGTEDDKFKNDAVKLEPMFQRCRFARVRTRFPVPVILWNNKNVSFLINYLFIYKKYNKNTK